ncbi:MAG: aldolase [Actinobacteria bacterium]|nr:aldolase [Actinomycetota bacterium]
MDGGPVTEIEDLNELRWTAPERFLDAVRGRHRPDPVAGPLLIIAADHTARGVLAVGRRAGAMADRGELLRRLVVALGQPGVHGFLGTADVVEDLAVLGALESRHVFGSMNRGGIARSSFELDDRVTGYTAEGIAAADLDGGKLLLRIDPDDPASVRTLETCGGVVTALAAQQRITMVEPFLSRRVDGVLHNDLSTEAVVRSVQIASGLGSTSAYTWLKIPAIDDMTAVAAATTLPLLILGGEVDAGNEKRWADALAEPSVRGLVIGRSLLYPDDDDVAGAVGRVVSLMQGADR